MSDLAVKFRENQMDLGVLPAELNAFSSADVHQKLGFDKPQIGGGAPAQLSNPTASLQVSPDPAAPMPGNAEKAALADRAAFASYDLQNSNIQGLRGPKAGDVGYLCGSVMSAGRELSEAFGSKSPQASPSQEPATQRMAMSMQPPRPLPLGL